jgi:hypothetical protein
VSSHRLNIEFQEAHQSFTREAESLLRRSSGYLAVARLRDGERLSWIEEGVTKPTSELVEEFKQLSASIKLFTQTSPPREGERGPFSLRLSYQALGALGSQMKRGGLFVYGHHDDMIILMTHPDELAERAFFWLSQYGDRIIRALNQGSSVS